MSKIILMMSVSLDGYFEGPDGDLEWQMVDEALHRHFNRELRAMGAFLDGRVTYELMAGFWPTADRDPSSTPAMVEFAGIWRDMPKVVYSRTLEGADWNAVVVRDVDAEEVRELKRTARGDLMLGGAILARSFMRLDLIDEYRVYVHPIVLGRGRRLFDPKEEATRLRLDEARTFGSGVVLLRYGRPDER